MATHSMAHPALARERACISRDQSGQRADSDPRPQPYPPAVWQLTRPSEAAAAHSAPPTTPPAIDPRKFRRRYILAWHQLGDES